MNQSLFLAIPLAIVAFVTYMQPTIDTKTKIVREFTSVIAMCLAIWAMPINVFAPFAMIMFAVIFLVDLYYYPHPWGQLPKEFK